jgi:hypothetical protein
MVGGRNVGDWCTHSGSDRSMLSSSHGYLQQPLVQPRPPTPLPGGSQWVAHFQPRLPPIAGAFSRGILQSREPQAAGAGGHRHERLRWLPTTLGFVRESEDASVRVWASMRLQVRASIRVDAGIGQSTTSIFYVSILLCIIEKFEISRVSPTPSQLFSVFLFYISQNV